MASCPTLPEALLGCGIAHYDIGGENIGLCIDGIRAPPPHAEEKGPTRPFTQYASQNGNIRRTTLYVVIMRLRDTEYM